MQHDEKEQPNTDTLQADTLTNEEDNTSDALNAQLAEEQRKSTEYLDLLRRTQADFINYKRRVKQEQAEARVNAQGSLVEKILPILDDLGRVMTSVPPELADHAWAQGVLLTSRQLASTLEQLGVKTLGAPGEPFDPYKHEAVMRVPNAEVPEDTVVQVIRPGYSMGERILRPAQVVVSGEAQV